MKIMMFVDIYWLLVLFSTASFSNGNYFDRGGNFSHHQSSVNQFYGCETSAYPPDERDCVPTRLIDLTLEPRLRWRELVLEKKSELVELVGHVYNLTELLLGESALHFLLDNLGKVISSLPLTYQQELEGIADAAGLELEQITFYNIFYEIFSFCTSIVIQDKHGQLYHGRNLDFGLFLGWNNATHQWRVTELLRPLVVQLEWHNTTSLVYTSVSYVGYIGIVTANKPDAFSFSVNERFSWDGGYVGLIEWIVFGDHKQQWLTTLTRDVLLMAGTYDEAVQQLATPRLLAPVYFTLAGTRPGQGCIITRYRDDYQLLNLGSADYHADWYLVQTNYDHWKTPPFYDDRRTPAFTCLDRGVNMSASGVEHGPRLPQARTADIPRSIKNLEAPGHGDFDNTETRTSKNDLSKSGLADVTADTQVTGCGILNYIIDKKRELQDVISSYWYAGLRKARRLLGIKENDQQPAMKKSSPKATLETVYDDNQEPLSLLYNVLSTRPVLNKLTTYTTLMSAKQGYIKTWVRQCPDPCWPW